MVTLSNMLRRPLPILTTRVSSKNRIVSGAGAGAVAVLSLVAAYEGGRRNKRNQEEDQKKIKHEGQCGVLADHTPQTYYSCAKMIKSIMPFKSWYAFGKAPDGENGTFIRSCCQCQDMGNLSTTAATSMKNPITGFLSGLSRHGTLRKMKSTATDVSLHSKYNTNWKKPIGKGAFGAVYLATEKQTGDIYALKCMTKECTDDVTFQREMNALLHIRAHGSHPNICSLRENFDEDGCFYLVLDYISGGEMFDHLANNGPYSEADAARLMREVSSALAFLHGIGVIHCDLKPENLMLSTDRPTNAVMKVVDFGCAQIMSEEVTYSSSNLQQSAGTPAYCPPEALDQSNPNRMQRKPSFDMWSLGIILYIMLTGAHPFDLTGKASNEKIIRRIQKRRPPPLRNSPLTAHLSESAIDLIDQLLKWDPEDRVTAIQMLDHPWVKGETARHEKMADSDKKLSIFRTFRSHIEAKVFADMVSWSENSENNGSSVKKSFFERSFDEFDTHRRGFLTTDDLKGTKESSKKGAMASGGPGSAEETSSVPISLSDFDELLSKNMKSKYFPTGHTIYKEGETGNHMYFINSGTIEISTEKGFSVRLKPGDFFGEGALLHPNKIRSATVKCVTPVHAIEINHEYFKKYLASPESAKSGLILNLREKDKTRNQHMAKAILGLQKEMKSREVAKGQELYKEGDPGTTVYLLDEGQIDISVQDHTVFSIKPGDVCGLHALITGRPRNSTAVCASDVCKLREMKAEDFHKLQSSSPLLKESFRDIWRRRQFQKGVVRKTNKSLFSAAALKEVFDAVDEDSNGTISREEIRNVLMRLDPSISEDEVKEVTDSLDLDESGSVDFEELLKIFASNKS